MDVDEVRAALAPLVAGRKVVLTGGVLAGLTRACRQARELGVERPFLLAVGRGTGPVPHPDDAEQLVLEALPLEAADAGRAGGAWTVSGRVIDRTEDHGLLLDGNAWRLAAGAASPSATLTLGPSNLGGFVRLDIDPTRVPPGPPVAPLAAAAFALADRELDTGLGPLEAARPVR